MIRFNDVKSCIGELQITDYKYLLVNMFIYKIKNTATLLHKALDGTKSMGADSEFIHLYDLTFKGTKLN